MASVINDRGHIFLSNTFHDHITPHIAAFVNIKIVHLHHILLQKNTQRTILKKTPSVISNKRRLFQLFSIFTANNIMIQFLNANQAHVMLSKTHLP